MTLQERGSRRVAIAVRHLVIAAGMLIAGPATFAQSSSTVDNAPPTGSRAKTFVENTQRRPPRANLTLALEMFADEFAAAREEGALHAADLGAGAGNESLYLMRKGWQVMAVDAEPFSIETVNNRAAVLRKSTSVSGTIDARATTMQQMSLPSDSLHLINASFSLPFVPRHEIDDVWKQCVQALREGGVCTAHFFGPDHEWRDNPDMSFFSVNEIFQRFVFDYPIQVRYLRHDRKDVNLAVGGKAFFDTITVIVEKRAK